MRGDSVQYNYYIDSNGDYVERPAESNPWKTGYTKRGFYAVKKYRNKLKRRRSFWYKVKRSFLSLFSRKDRYG